MYIVHSVLLLLIPVSMTYYWVEFYVKGEVQVVNDESYIKFQKAFVAADSWAAICAIVGAIGLLSGQTYGMIFALITGSSLIFLGLMDVAFNIQNNLYRLLRSSGEMKLELLLNLFSLGLGITFIASLAPRLIMA
jgi:hypothetical protein